MHYQTIGVWVQLNNRVWVQLNLHMNKGERDQ